MYAQLTLKITSHFSHNLHLGVRSADGISVISLNSIQYCSLYMWYCFREVEIEYWNTIEIDVRLNRFLRDLV